MVKKLKKLLKANWIRRCSVFMCCALILICSVTPAFAYVYDSNGMKVNSILKGDVVLYPSNFYDESTLSRFVVRMPIGGRMPWFAVTGTNDSVFRADYYEPLNDSLYFRAINNLARYKQVVSYPTPSGTPVSATLDDYRYNVYTDFIVDGSVEKAYFDQFVYIFDPTFLSGKGYPEVIEKLFTLRLTVNVQVISDITIAYVVNNEIRHATFGSTMWVGNSNVWSGSPLSTDVFTAMRNHEAFNPNINPTRNILIESFTVQITPPLDSDVSGLSFELLSEQYDLAVPTWFVADDMAEWNDFVDRYIDFVPSTPGNSVNPSPGSSNQFTVWLASAVSGFFDFEIFPNFSFGGIISAVLSVAIAIVLLKFFAGG